MALKRVNFATAHNASTFTSARWNFQPVPDGFGNAPIQLVEIAPGNPRFAYNPETGEPKGLLIEEQRTNLTRNSSDMTISPWVLDSNQSPLASISTASNPKFGQVTILDASQIDSANSGRCGVMQGHVLTAGEVYTASVYVEQVQDGFARFSIFETDLISINFAIDLSDASVVSSSFNDPLYISHKIEDVGGAYRMIITFTAPSATSSLRVIINSATPTGEPLHNSPGGIISAALAQVEQGAFATSPIITNGTAVTRTADNVARTLGAEFNPNEGAFVIEFEIDGSVISTRSPIGLHLNSTNYLQFRTQAAISSFGYVVNNGGVISSSNTSPLSNGRNILSFRLSGNFLTGFAVNGTLYSVNVAAPVNLFTNLAFGDATPSARYLNNSIKSVTYEPRAVSDTELQELSTL